MAFDGISRNDYDKLMGYTLNEDNFEHVSRNRGRGQNNAWAGNYCFPDGSTSTEDTPGPGTLFNVKSQRF